MTKNVTRLFAIGAVTIAAIYVFRYQQGLAQGVVRRVQSRDPEQIVIAMAITVGVGLVGVVAASALRKI
jgi:hypothetical protein